MPNSQQKNRHFFGKINCDSRYVQKRHSLRNLSDLLMEVQQLSMKLKHLKVPGKVLKFRQICGFMKSHCEYYLQ